MTGRWYEDVSHINLLILTILNSFAVCACLSLAFSSSLPHLWFGFAPPGEAPEDISRASWLSHWVLISEKNFFTVSSLDENTKRRDSVAFQIRVYVNTCVYVNKMTENKIYFDAQLTKDKDKGQKTLDIRHWTTQHSPPRRVA